MTNGLDGARKQTALVRTVSFIALSAIIAAAIAYWIHHRDTTHGDHWDWSDWLEGILASAAAGVLIAGGIVKAARLAAARTH